MKRGMSKFPRRKKRARGKGHHVGRILIVSLCLALLGAALNLLADKAWPASAQKISTGGEALWQEVDEKTIPLQGERAVVPTVYRTFRLDQKQLSSILAVTPKEFSPSAATAAVTITLPMPDGKLARFHAEESPIMEPGLAAQFPEIKTYRGQGIDDPTATTRFDLTPAGFHAIVLSASDTVYVDPYAKDETAHYVSYYKRDYRRQGASFQCFFDEANKDLPQAPARQAPSVSNAGTLRTYRLALAATVEYTAAAGGTVPAAMARMTTTMNRVNGIYERDLSIRMVMVANNASLVFTAEPDGYTNNNGFTMLGQNQTKLDTVIGNANYDIGHVFSTGGGGVAQLNVPCVTNNKARGVTGLSNPVGDVFDVDYVSHEIGHQFGANHTFNGSSGSCSSSFSPAKHEPGSGSTIMAYAGICSLQDLQLNSNDYFHVKSIEEILDYVTNGSGTCAAQTATGNSQPTVNAGPDFTIPKGTPFTLTATGGDPNGDALTYCWEEYDLGPSSPPDNDADGFARPIFRSYSPVPSSSRTFPSLGYILNNANTPPPSYACANGVGVCATGEVLPAITRQMSFQVTARDNRAGGGGISTDTVAINVTATSGPFFIMQPDTATTWNSGESQTVTWDVANTTAGPVNCANVKISLSTDGGNTFPVVVAASTPNDGTQNVIVPCAPTTKARIKVEAVGNIFFDVSSADFTINGPGISVSPSTQFFPATGGAGSVSVSTPAVCAWAAASNSSWIVLTSSGSGSGSDPVTFEVRENFTAAARQGILTVGGQNVTIIQNAAGADCAYAIAPGSAFFAAGGGAGNVTVTTTANCAWQAASQTPWITVTSGSAGSGNGAVGFSVAANASGKGRSGTIRVAGKTFAVKQGG
ncbi:MAG TPA: zinc-dependent metalloprotease family protein [Blastocatellia bacterium]|nr:zinc-dependent metalloprotease family protein [Blastocatellia bacterium]